jgi:hypothetical protein
MALKTFLCGLSHDLGISQCKKGKNFLQLRNTDINVYTLFKCKDKQSQNKYFSETKMLYMLAYNIEIALLLKGTLFHCSNHIKFNKTM